MKNFQFLFFAFFLTFLACQGDPATQVKTSVDKTSKVAVTSTSDKAEEKVEEKANEIMESDSDSPELIEFYVEEDKKKRTATKKKSSSSSSSTETTEVAEATKAVAPPKKKAKVKKKAAKMKFNNDTFAFGVIKPGDVIEHKFEFTNTGTKDLVITNAEATCGCTQPSFPFIPIPPGEKGYIGVKYDSTGKLGTQKPTVTLTTNAYPKTQKVYLEGVVIGKMAN